jgi:hypothetical protein
MVNINSTIASSLFYLSSAHCNTIIKIGFYNGTNIELVSTIIRSLVYDCQ